MKTSSIFARVNDLPDITITNDPEELTSFNRPNESGTRTVAIVPEEAPPQISSPLIKMLLRLRRKLLDLIYETIVMIAYLGAIAILHIALDNWLGKEVKFFDYLPISHIIDFGHVLVIGKFLLEIAKDVYVVIRSFSCNIEE